MTESRTTPPQPVEMATNALFDDTPNPPPDVTATKKSQWKHLFAFTRRSHAAPLVAALLASAATAGVKTALAVFLGKIFDVIGDYGTGERNGSDTVSTVSDWCLVLIGVGFGNWVASSAFLGLWIVFGELQAASVRQHVLSSLIYYDMAWFDTRDQGISSLLVRIQTQTRELQLATSQLLGLLISDTMTSLGSLCLAFYYSWKLTLVLLATLPISAGVLALATRPLDPAIQKQKGHLGSASKHVTSSISAIDLVNVFNGHDYQLRQYARSIRHAAQAYLVQARCNSIQMGYVSFWVISMFVVGFWYGLDLVEHGLSPGDVLTTFYATLASFQGIEALMPHWLVLSKGMSAGAFLKDVVAENSQSGPLTRKEQTRHAITPDRCFGRVELSHVAFAYPSTPDTLVVEHVSLLFPAGETTFIVGTSGSGKSTIGSLVCNLYEPLAGYIRIDGKPIKALDPSWVQDNINLVQQSSVLFDDTLFNNVALGGRDPESVSRQQVLAACDAAMLQTTIAALPDGLDTNIGPEGHTLSGGQKQRVALARAFLRDAPVMILDEITSGLDYVTRSLVMNSIRARRRNKTTIIITHDTSQIASDDFVYVMKNHRLVQQGLHSQLLTQDNGHFMALVAKESTPAPLTIDITPPDDDASSLSTRPETPLVRSRSTRVADFVVDRIGNGSLYPGSPPPSNRLSFGIPVNYSLRLRREDVAAQEAPIPSAQNVELDAPEWTEEMKRFSTYLSSHFSLGSEYQQLHSPAATLTLPTTSEVIHEESIRRPSLRSSHRSSHRTSYPNSVINYSPSVYSVRDSQFSESGDIELTCTDPYKAVRSDTPPYSRFDPFHDEGPLLDNDIALSKPPKKKDSIFTVLGTVWPGVDVRDRLTLILGIISGIIGATATPAFSYAFAQLLGVLTSPGDKAERGTKWACIMLGLAIIDGVCWGGSRYLLERVAVSWVDKMRNEALKRILLQPRPWFAQSKNSAGRISECLDRNAEEMRNIVGKFIPIVVAVVTMISVSVIWALAVSWKLALVALTPLPAMLGAVKIFTILSSKWEDRCNKVAEDASATATEILVNVRILRSFALERYFTKRYTQRVHQTLLIGLKRAVFTCGAYGLYQLLNYSMTCLVFYYGTVLLADKKELVVADVMQVINLLLFSIGTATGILSGIPQLTMAQATASQMIAYANMPTSPPDSQTGHAKPMTPLPISMKNLTYSRNHNVILRGVSLDIQPGRCTAIVGHSGCGKSTIVSLLLGLEAASNTGTGYLTYSSIPSNHVDLGYMRRRADMMSYVPQAAVLFPASILDNITYGLPMDSPLRSADNVVYAARAASLHEWIMSLPQGYATIVGDGGQALSGGQAQRLSIARALVRHPALLVLDEPTSALDADNAAVIKQAIRNAQSPGRAVVLVTHSQDMMSAADHIIVLGEGGVVVQQGSYQELVTTKGAFANLVGSGVEDI